MNEEVNFCSQCGVTVSLSAKFCSNCGCDLQNSSTQTPLDKTIKVGLEQNVRLITIHYRYIHKHQHGPNSLIISIVFRSDPGDNKLTIC